MTWISHGCTCVPWSWTLFPPPSPSHPSGLSQCTSFECPASCIKLALVIYFTYSNTHISMLFSQIIPPLPSPTEYKSLFFIHVVFCCLAYRVVITIFLNSIYICVIRLCATPKMAAHQASPSLRFSRQEHWSGLPFPAPMHESEKWKWSRSVVSDSVRPHGLPPTRLLRPWDFPGKSTRVGCHCLLHSIGDYIQYSVIKHNGKEYKKECVYMFIWITLLYSRKSNSVNPLYCNLKFLKRKIHIHSCRLKYFGEKKDQLHFQSDRKNSSNIIVKILDLSKAEF